MTKDEVIMHNRFCSRCGTKTKSIVPDGDNRVRDVCPSCGQIHYVNPKMVAGCIVEEEDCILLCRRSIEPQHGKWTIPAGYMEIHETVAKAALRETYEECGAEVELCGPYRLFDLPAISQIYLIFRAKLLTCPFQPTSESLEVRLFPVDEIPWEQIAFPVITMALRHYIDDVQIGRFSFANKVVHP